MKLCAAYTVFNGLEMLEKSIEQIKNHVDEIIICYQTTSNKGNRSDSVLPFCKTIAEKYGAKLLEFTPNLSISTKENEIRKHNLMIDGAKILKCSHFLLLATDHYFKKEEFQYAKNFCEENNVDLSFTKMYTYYKNPEWQLTPIEYYVMPFILRIKENTRYQRHISYPAYTDPSVQTPPDGICLTFDEKQIMMHHYSMIRSDIKNKFNNAAASIRWSEDDRKRFISEYENYDIKTNPGISYFGGRKIKQVPNYFNI